MSSEVPWIWALEKGFYVNLVLEIENVTLKAQLFSELVESFVLLRSQLQNSASAVSTFYICQCVKFQDTFESHVPFWPMENIVMCSLLEESNMLNCLMMEYLVAYCDVFAQG